MFNSASKLAVVGYAEEAGARICQLVEGCVRGYSVRMYWA